MYSNKLSGSMRALTIVEAQVMATDSAKSALKREHLSCMAHGGESMCKVRGARILEGCMTRAACRRQRIRTT
jgi:hypothetical protein